MRSDGIDENMKLRSWISCLVLFLAAASSSLRAQDPQISDFNPKFGAPGDIITITTDRGSFISGTIKIRCSNGVLMTNGSRSQTTMTVTVPNGASTGYLTIQKDNGQVYYSASAFTAIGNGPFISYLAPGFATAGEQVEIGGVHLASVSAVSFNGTNFGGAMSKGSDGTWIHVNVPSGASSGFISVTNTLGTSNSPSPFTVIGPGPYISEFSPTTGNSSYTLTNMGRFFTSATNVQFGALNAASFRVVSDTMITAQPPTNVMTGPITIKTTAGNYTTPTNWYVQPAITNVSPASGRAGTNVLITGSSFIGTTAVTFNGTPATFSVINNWTIQATVPTNVSSGQIWVTAPAGIAISSATFTIAPTILGFAPGSGGVGTAVTISGANFNVGTPVVRFNGVQAATPTGVSFGQLTAVVPAGATNGLISVTTTDGSDTNANVFYLPASITSFTPTNSAPGTRITITGQNFIGATSVTFNGTPASFSLTNNTTIGATVPANVTTGPIAITTPAGTMTSSSWFYGPPLITAFSPSHGTPGTNVTITGTNFLSPITVSFNGLSAQVNSLSWTQAVVVVPGGAQTGPITVATPAGTNTTAASFIVDQPADLFLWHVGVSNVVTVGSNLVYTIQLGSRGPFSAPNAKFYDLLPPNVDLVSATIQQGTLATNGNPIVGSLGTLPNGSQPICVITVVPRVAGYITNTVTITSDAVDPAPSDNQESFVTFVHSQPVLSIAQAAGQVAVSWPGDLTNYVLQSRPLLDPSLFWSNVTVTPTFSNNQNVVTEPRTNSNKFYRLLK
jgi:hypothetical protein